MKHHNRNTKIMKHSLLFISNDKFLSEAATESHWEKFWRKKMLLKSRQNPWKISVKGFIFSKIAGYKPATLLKVNPFTWIFQGFCLDFKSFAVVFKIFQNTYFPEQLSMTVSVCVEAIFSTLLRLLFKDVLLINHDRRQHTN